MDRRMRGIFWIAMIVALAFPVLMLAGCGGGGGSSGVGSSGSTVNVSMASTVPNAVPVSAGTFSPGPTSVTAAAPPTDNIDHVWVTVHRVSLIPGSGSPGPDPNGENPVQDLAPPNAAGHISADLKEQEEIDLLNLPAAGLALARFLNAIPNVPAGTYGKIRLYYTDPKVHFVNATENAAMHATANFHLDIHFKGEKLVIPEATGGGVQLFEVTVVFVLGKDGLKVNVGPNKILMRPQVFATVSEVRFVLTGTVDNTDKVASTFDLAVEDGRIFDISYDPLATTWSFRESGANARTVAIDNQAFAIAALNDGATASVIGVFSSGVFLADDITITFPVTRAGTVVSGTPASGWLANDTFILGLAVDNVVIPRPSRSTARYDNNADLSLLAIGQAAIVQGAVVTARGYAVPGGTEAYWISVGP